MPINFFFLDTDTKPIPTKYTGRIPITNRANKKYRKVPNLYLIQQNFKYLQKYGVKMII